MSPITKNFELPRGVQAGGRGAGTAEAMYELSWATDSRSMAVGIVSKALYPIGGPIGSVPSVVSQERVTWRLDI